ncbi:hypothetical protein AGLY_000609 [Aphis glycines]|uniref:Uncharacterized protein n=1 Tax=Aphis glycines TaxID=307491 RepID=A0A6G0UA13_APHGL|nr:hypothetical protein AGLY_000609 [Aphis glycines]
MGDLMMSVSFLRLSLVNGLENSTVGNTRIKLFFMSMMLATDSGKETAVSENAATMAPVAPKDSNILRNSDSSKNTFLSSIKLIISFFSAILFIYVIIGVYNTVPGLTSQHLKPGEVILLYGWPRVHFDINILFLLTRCKYEIKSENNMFYINSLWLSLIMRYTIVFCTSNIVTINISVVCGKPHTRYTLHFQICICLVASCHPPSALINRDHGLSTLYTDSVVSLVSYLEIHENT